MADGTGAIAVQRRVMVSGEQLVGAQQEFDQDGRPVVGITFNAAGARRFGRVTQENVGKPFAMILDDKVLSAPTSTSRSLAARRKSAATSPSKRQSARCQPRLGQAAVKLNVIEERTVSAELGRIRSTPAPSHRSSPRCVIGLMIITLAVRRLCLAGAAGNALMTSASWRCSTPPSVTASPASC